MKKQELLNKLDGVLLDTYNELVEVYAQHVVIEKAKDMAYKTISKWLTSKEVFE